MTVRTPANTLRRQTTNERVKLRVVPVTNLNRPRVRVVGVDVVVVDEPAARARFFA
jgi:hypothetical protein